MSTWRDLNVTCWRVPHVTARHDPWWEGRSYLLCHMKDDGDGVLSQLRWSPDHAWNYPCYLSSLADKKLTTLEIWDGSIFLCRSQCEWLICRVDCPPASCVLDMDSLSTLYSGLLSQRCKTRHFPRVFFCFCFSQDRRTGGVSVVGGTWYGYGRTAPLLPVPPPRLLGFWSGGWNLWHRWAVSALT